MNHAHEHDAGHAHGSRRTYVIGFLLSVVMTAIPFWMVMTRAADPQTTAITIMVFAVAQILVHTFALLHVNTKAEGGWTLLAYIFTAVLVGIVLAGSLWIMYHLNMNMMALEAAP